MLVVGACECLPCMSLHRNRAGTWRVETWQFRCCGHSGLLASTALHCTGQLILTPDSQDGHVHFQHLFTGHTGQVELTKHEKHCKDVFAFSFIIMLCCKKYIHVKHLVIGHTRQRELIKHEINCVFACIFSVLICYKMNISAFTSPLWSLRPYMRPYM